MRNYLVGAIALLGACKWTEFDDLKSEAWVNATDKPDNGSSNWGVAIGRSQKASAMGARVTVLGSASPVFNEITFNANGEASIAPDAVKLGASGIAALEEETLLVANPDADEQSLVVNTGVGSILVLKLPDVSQAFQLFSTDPKVGGATYVSPMAGLPVVIGVAAGSELFGPPPATKCTIADGGSPVVTRALGTIGATKSEVALWGANGKLYVIPGNFVAGTCPADLAGAPSVDVGFQPADGTLAQIINVDDTHFLLQGHTATAGFITLVSNTGGTLSLVGTAQMTAGVKTIALYADNGKHAVVAGYPRDQVEGVNAGKVLIYSLDLTAGINPTATELLHDADPEEGQSFGRSIAVVPFNGKQVIAVGAANEVFFYFRTGSLYTDDARTNR